MKVICEEYPTCRNLSCEHRIEHEESYDANGSCAEGWWCPYNNSIIYCVATTGEQR